MRGAGIESVAQMQFEKTALFFDDQDGIEARGKLAGEFLIERERHAELGDANAELFQFTLAESEIAQGLSEVVVGFPGAGETEPGSFSLAMPAIDAIQTGE